MRTPENFHFEFSFPRDKGIGLPIVSEFRVESSNGFVDLIPTNDSRSSLLLPAYLPNQTSAAWITITCRCLHYRRARDYKFRSDANNNLLNIIFPLPRTCEKASNTVEDGRILNGGVYL